MLPSILASCKLSAPEGSQVTQPNPDAIFTAAAQTAESRRFERLTQTAAHIPKETPAAQPPVETLAEIPTQISLGTITGTLTQTSPLGTPSGLLTPSTPVVPTITRAPTDAAVVSGEDKAVFIDDVTIPDGTKFSPGKRFQKTWRIENTGKTTWNADYALVFIDGDLMGASSVVAIPQEVKPWEKVNVAIDMVAPTVPGKYTSYWMMRNASGKIFGFGENRDESIWVQIVVENTLASDLEPADQEATSTAAASRIVGAVTLGVDNPLVYDCPHTFLLTGLIALNKASTVTYILEGGDNTGSPLKLPIPATRNLEVGAHPVLYELTFSKSITGWARLRVTQPEPLLSDQVNFSLNCG